MFINNDIYISKNLFAKRIQTFVYENKKVDELSLNILFSNAKESIVNILKNMLLEHQNIKFNIELFAEYIKFSKTNEIEDDDSALISVKSFQTKMVIAQLEQDLSDMYDNHSIEIATKMDEFQERDSGWSLVCINKIEINVNKYCPIKGSKYLELPIFIRNKKACINIKNNDNYCFKWALIAALENNHLNPKYSHYSNVITQSLITLPNGITIDFTNLTFPLSIADIKIFEKYNLNISVNVFGCDVIKKEIVGPYYKTADEKINHINLLYIQDDKNDESHYVWIKNISRLLSTQVSKHLGAKYFCNFCLRYSTSELMLLKHKQECNKIVTKMPTGVDDDNILLFKNFKNQLDVPFVIYADFECILSKINNKNSNNVTSIQKHIPIAYSYYIKSSFDSKLNKFRTYTGNDVVKDFVQNLIEDARFLCTNFLMKVVPMNSLLPHEVEKHYNTNECHICKQILDDDRCADHCHLTGQYRGPAHWKCNINYQLPNFIPIIFHNFSGYDCHLFVKALADYPGDIDVIPLNKELYISVRKRIQITDKYNLELRFLDSFKFMSASLDKLSNYLHNDDFKTLKSIYSNDLEFNLLKRKGIFPYDYIDSVEKLNENVLPSREQFFSTLNNKECTIVDYEHALSVWSTFNCQSLNEYMLLYLKTDVLLLTDVFENFRSVCKSIYHLDPCHYYTTPGLSWDAMLKITKIKLELFTDINMYNFIKKGIRGGIVQCTTRRTVANHKYIKTYDCSKPSQYLMYLDANNLYGWAMSESLPEGKFEWIEDIDSFDISKVSENSDFGYILEVDLDYPEELHDSHNDLPFCAELKSPSIKHHNIKKLIPDLTNKKSYIIHYRNLQQCIRNGLKLAKIHRILRFKQSTWLKQYIDLNTFHRTNAKNEFEKNFFKLLNNAVYGKTMENVEKRKNVKIVNAWESEHNRLGARALIAKPNFHSSTHFTDNMIAIQMSMVSVTFNKPIYLGFSVLELSKYKMYDFHYQYMQTKFNENLKLNYMDTDSLIYTIRTNDFYKDIYNDLHLNFDTSDYSINNVFNFPLQNKKVLGMMKDENNGHVMLEFIGLRSKVYSISVNDKEEIKKAKGVKKSALKKLTINDYRNCLIDKTIYHDKMYIFKSILHEIYTQQISKVVLSYDDDKRYIREDGINTYAWGHYKINKN